MIIPETLLKIKRPVRLALEALAITLVLGAVFLVGRISGLSQYAEAEPIEVIYPPLVTTNIPQYQEKGASQEPSSWAFAGSKTGKSYYPKGCSGLDRIKPENRVYFTTESEAIQAGLMQSSLCK